MTTSKRLQARPSRRKRGWRELDVGVRVGYGPKTLQRVLRLRRFLRTGAGDLGRAALDAGYSDQAHLTRECRRLTGLPPAALIRSS